MDGKPEEKKFIDIFKGGAYKNYSTLKSSIVTPVEIFKRSNVKKSNQFSFRINPMKWHDREAAIDTRNSYLSATNWASALQKIGKTEEDLFPSNKDGGEIKFEDADFDVWCELIPYMDNNAMSKKYYHVVYETVRDYTESVVLSKGYEEDFHDCFEYFSQDKIYMQFLFNEIIKNSTLKTEEIDAVK